eukprot:TRINITY_DN15071_c0_g1_i3.p1 TRINITY_DN15071_c0_g1~~TRINITY_DN15071_c0_g1_i3.p1  ORF type:complete len:419 (+),score=69.53 TRINITY_DN15071_c0_g1_i3:324-1580(+)
MLEQTCVVFSPRRPSQGLLHEAVRRRMKTEFGHSRLRPPSLPWLLFRWEEIRTRSRRDEIISWRDDKPALEGVGYDELNWEDRLFFEAVSLCHTAEAMDWQDQRHTHSLAMALKNLGVPTTEHIRAGSRSETQVRMEVRAGAILVESGLIPVLVRLLAQLGQLQVSAMESVTGTLSFVTLCVGTVKEVIKILPQLQVHLLSELSPDIQVSAAATLANVADDPVGATAVVSAGYIPLLTDLLVATQSVDLQGECASALANISFHQSTAVIQSGVLLRLRAVLQHGFTTTRSEVARMYGNVALSSVGEVVTSGVVADLLDVTKSADKNSKAAAVEALTIVSESTNKAHLDVLHSAGVVAVLVAELSATPDSMDPEAGMLMAICLTRVMSQQPESEVQKLGASLRYIPRLTRAPTWSAPDP